MGSFNTRCFLSHQTIKPGQEVVIFPLKQQSGYNHVMVHAPDQPAEQASFAMAPTHSTCYSDAFWSFYAPMLRGEYADYGQMTLYDTDENVSALRAFFNTLYESAMVTMQGDNEYHEKAFHFQSLYNPKNTYSFNELHQLYETVEEAINSHRVYVRDHRGVVSAALTVASSLAFDEMITTMEHMPSWDGSVTTRNNKQEAAWSSVIAWLESETEYKDSMLWSHRFERATRFRGDAHHMFTNAYAIREDVLEPILREYFSTRDIEALKTSLFAISDNAMTVQYFLSGLECFEIKVQPLTYAGQDYSNEIGRIYHAYMGRVEMAIRATLDLDDEEEDDEEDAA